MNKVIDWMGARWYRLLDRWHVGPVGLIFRSLFNPAGQ